MEKEEFKRRLLEQQIFDELKDGYHGGVNYIKNKWQGCDIDPNRIYRRIINYRIKTYGTSYMVSPNKDIEKPKEECKHLFKLARQMKYRRLGKYRDRD